MGKILIIKGADFASVKVGTVNVDIPAEELNNESFLEMLENALKVKTAIAINVDKTVLNGTSDQDNRAAIFEVNTDAYYNAGFRNVKINFGTNINNIVLYGVKDNFEYYNTSKRWDWASDGSAIVPLSLGKNLYIHFKNKNDANFTNEGINYFITSVELS